MKSATNDVPPMDPHAQPAGPDDVVGAAMAIPSNMNAQWIATLGDAELVVAEARLHADFREGEVAEKARCGSRYVLLESPAPVVNAWLRWLMVSNETRSRGLVVHRSR